MDRLLQALSGNASPPTRGLRFWLVTALLGLLLPAPVAVVVVAARLRGGGTWSPGDRSGQ